MYIQKNITIAGSSGKPIALDLFSNDGTVARPVVIYTHGFNGFKDWGNFDLIARRIAAEGFTFVKFNFSHNGTTPEQPEEFTDLDAFGKNNYTKELDDLQYVIDWACDASNPHADRIDASSVALIGHSRGGGITIIKALEESRVTALVTWASVAACKTPWGNWNDERMSEWRSTGLQYYHNGRTQQDMPMYYQLYEDYLQHASRLDVISAMQHLRIPVLICHGTDDAAVPFHQAQQLHDANPDAQLFVVESDHVFGRKHPWVDTNLPFAMQQVLDATLIFLKQQLTDQF